MCSFFFVLRLDGGWILCDGWNFGWTLAGWVWGLVFCASDWAMGNHCYEAFGIVYVTIGIQYDSITLHFLD